MKRFLSALALLCVVCLCLSVPVAAQTEATVSAAKVTANPGDTVEIPITITRVEEAIAIGMHVWYDPAVLRCVEAVMSDTVGGMTMAGANTEPVNHPNEVWLTAVNLQPVVLDGTVMTLTFEVLADAPAGASPVKVLKDGLSVSVRENMREITVGTADGAVTVNGNEGDVSATSQVPGSTVSTDAVTTTTAKEPVASQTTTTTEQTVANSESDTSVTTAPPITQVNGETIELPEQTLVDVQGNIVTDASGAPSSVKTVAVMIDSHTATIGDTVTATVSLSAVADLEAIGLSVRYDTDALSFEGGEFVGFVTGLNGMAAVNEGTEGVVDLSALGQGVSGSGDIATLRFKVKNTAKNGDYRLSCIGGLYTSGGAVELPMKSVAGRITVEGAPEGLPIGVYVGGAIGVAAIVAVAAWLCVRRKKAIASAPKKVVPSVTDVSGEE